MVSAPMSASRNSILDAPQEMRVGRRRLRRDQDRGVSTMLTAASWLLQRLPGLVREDQRGDLVSALSQARDLAVTVRCNPPIVYVHHGNGEVLVAIPARTERR
jgi:hypothetical protein